MNDFTLGATRTMENACANQGGEASTARDLAHSTPGVRIAVIDATVVMGHSATL